MGFMEDRSLRLSLVGQMVKNTSAVQDPWVRKIPPGEGNVYPLQYSCLENPVDREPGGLQLMGVQRV